MSKGIHLIAKQIDKIFELYLQGIKQKYIAERFDVSPRTVNRAVKQKLEAEKVNA